MMKMNGRVSIGSYAFIFFMSIVIVGMSYRYDIAPLCKQLILDKKEEKKLIEQTKNLFYQQVLLEEGISPFPQVKRMLMEWQGKLIKERDVDRLMVQIKKISKTNQLEGLDFRWVSNARENHYGKQTFHVVIKGTYADIIHFINQIAALPWVVVIGNFTFSWWKMLDENKPLWAEMDLQVYHL